MKGKKVSELLEKYEYSGIGYKPFLIRPGWQVAKLNYMPEQGIGNISKIDVHFKTDEAFILVSGTAILIVATIEDEEAIFHCEKMVGGITYNIPKNTWHNIAMKEDAEVIIVEKDNTHIGDYAFRQLNDDEKLKLDELIQTAM